MNPCSSLEALVDLDPIILTVVSLLSPLVGILLAAALLIGGLLMVYLTGRVYQIITKVAEWVWRRTPLSRRIVGGEKSTPPQVIHEPMEDDEYDLT